MKQVLQSIKDGRIAVVDLPTPRPAQGEILVHVAASLVSAGTERMVGEFAKKSLWGKAGARPDLVKQTLDKARKEGLISTLEAVRNRLDEPISLGYSCAGRVIWTDEAETGLRQGDLVACAGSSYAVHAQVVSVPTRLTAKVPDSVDLESATFTTLGAIAMQGVRLANCRFGESVGVIGLGVLGQLTVLILKSAGCRVAALDPRKARSDLAGQMGADAYSSETLEFKAACQQISGGQGVDSVLIAADTPSNQPVELAAEVARDRATIVAVGAVGTKLPRKPYFEKELEFRISRSYGPGRYDPSYEEKGLDYPIGYVRWTEHRNMQAFLQLNCERPGLVTRLITHRFPVERAPEAYQLISGAQPSMGVLITYPLELDLRSRLSLKPSRGSSGARRDRGQKRVQVGLIGTGNFAASVLLPAMRSLGGMSFKGACSTRGLRARYLGDKFGFEYCTSDEEEIFSDEEVNTVVISTRHHLHCRQIVRGLQALKHVFCEKPPCLNEEELARIATARWHQRRLGSETLFMVGYNRRFAPMTMKLKEHLHGLTEPLILHYRINAGHIPAHHWIQDRELGGGRVIGEVCHFVDLLTFLAGSKPVEVTAASLPNLERYCDDNLTATLRFANGSVGTVSYAANGDKAFPKERIEVFGQGLAASLEDFRSLRIIRNGKRFTDRSRLRQDKGHRNEWKAWMEAFKKGATEIIPFEEIVSTSLSTFAIQSALRSSQPTGIPLDEFLSRENECLENQSSSEPPGELASD